LNHHHETPSLFSLGFSISHFFPPVYFLRIAPGRLARHVAWLYSSHNLGQKQGGCWSKLYISPIGNIFLVPPWNPFKAKSKFSRFGLKLRTTQIPCIY
jgi:hypothetical protein